MAYGLACSTTCGIFLNQGSNPCFLHWQADSLPLSPQGGPFKKYLFYLFGCTESWLPHMGSLVVACGILFPDQVSNPGPLHWQCGVLAGPPGTSHSSHSLLLLSSKQTLIESQFSVIKRIEVTLGIHCVRICPTLSLGILLR